MKPKGKHKSVGQRVGDQQQQERLSVMAPWPSSAHFTMVFMPKRITSEALIKVRAGRQDCHQAEPEVEIMSLIEDHIKGLLSWT